MSFAFINQLYEQVAHVEDLEKRSDPSDNRRLRHTHKVLSKLVTNEAKLLEVGPGNGFISGAIKDLISRYNLDFFALDISAQFLKKTRAKSGGKATIITSNISETNFHIHEKFDFILCQEVIEHLTAPFVALVNMNACLKSDGYLIITIPNTFRLRYIWQLILCQPTRILDTHIAEISPIGLLKLVSMAGFEPISLAFKNTKWHWLPNPLTMFLSSEIFLVATKISGPELPWKELTSQIMQSWNEF
jgi:2-polyprenyl-3-methyl-5-hydroxy-6-metoxy-1,4-benzoquinol methylase